jgi:hypothetical protein
MSDLNKVVPITDYRVGITHHFDNFNLVLDTPCFSEINNYYSSTKKQGVPVKQYLTLNSLLERLNTIKQRLSKNNSIAILKGLYKGGTSGAYCYQGAPFLFFDIDVKKDKENTHLLDAFNNAEVFSKLQDIAVMVWRSNSGDGIAGVLYVPQLASLKNNETKKHLAIGKEICNYLKNTLNVNAEFDDAQNKYRQVRYLARQTEKRYINTKPCVFNYEVTEIFKTSQTGVTQYRHIDNRAVSGTIADQFNRDVSIHTALLDNGFYRLNDIRYKHPNTTSKSTGSVKGNVFLNASTSFSQYKVFTPFWLFYTQNYNFDIKQLLNDLEEKGYKEIKPSNEAFKQAKNKLEHKANDREKQIFDVCFNLVNANYKDKVSFANDNAKNDAEKILFYDYLKLKSLNIPYDKTLSINKYVSEQLKEVLDYADINTKTILTAETGTGKTTAFLKDFSKYRPTKRLLILAPLTAIVEQTKAEFNSIVSLTGNSTPSDHTKAKTAPLVIATYEQGYKHLSNSNTFDYVVIDEIHNLITAHSYKRETIKQLTRVLKLYNVIGLTGTPNLLFKSVGYKLVNVKKETQNKVEVNFIVDNRAPLKIALQHLQNVKGKCIMRINSRSVATALKNELVALGNYTKDEVLILNSDAHIKKGNDFKQLTEQSKFDTKIKLVITTSIIDEGLSIKQSGFSDVVFIETEYKPMPEAVKQFFARFRNNDPNRKNYFYYRETKEQSLISWNPFFAFNETKNNLIADAESFRVNDTEKKDITNTKYLYYEDTTVNDYALAFDISMSYFKMMTKQEYIHFLELNYNINIIENKDYSKTDIDTTNSKEIAEQNKTLIASSWLNQQEDILEALYTITDSLEIKKSVDYIGLNLSDEVYDLVSNNLKTFEDLHTYTLKLENLGITNATSVLIDLKKMQLIDLRIINRTITKYENLDTINNPKTKIDLKNKDKLLNFVNEVLKLEDYTKADVFRVWNKQRCNSKKPSYYNLIDLVNHYKKTG